MVVCWWVILVLLSSFPLSRAGCGTYTASDKKSTYHLDGLTKPDGDYSGTETPPGSDITYLYYWNFCQPIKSISVCANPTDATVIQTASTGDCYVTGYLPTKVVSDHPSGAKTGVRITYSNNQLTCLNGAVRTSYFDIGCDPSVEYVLSGVNELGTCQYQFSIRSKHGCPVAASDGGDKDGDVDGLSPGSVFLIVFFIGLALYFALGAVVKWKVYSSTGVEMIPNTDFWTSLPGLIRDGCIFVKNKATGASGYSSV